ncbi:MAG: FadR family transcriptional regulator [Oxalobacteraceae bacterium]|nr:MAG: FadR family transcriptional regulator [Oxalobacteraceae bacterium]
MEHESAPVVTLLQAYLATTRIPADGRLPPERELAEALGISRSQLRKALSVMETDGQLWRHVGRGTFLGPTPLAAINDAASLATAAAATDITQARLLMEPELAALAAVHGTAAHAATMRDAMQASCRPGQTWRGYEAQDERLHREIAAAAGNPVLLSLYDQLATIRRVLTWKRVRKRIEGPTLDHPSFAEHERVVAAIIAKDAAGARTHMQHHITPNSNKHFDKQARSIDAAIYLLTSFLYSTPLHTPTPNHIHSCELTDSNRTTHSFTPITLYLTFLPVSPGFLNASLHLFTLPARTVFHCIHVAISDVKCSNRGIIHLGYTLYAPLFRMVCLNMDLRGMQFAVRYVYYN